MDAADLVVTTRDELPRPWGDRGYQTHPRNPWTGIPGLGLAMRFCRVRDEDGTVHGLAHFTKRIPDDALAKACTIGRGPEVWIVSCPCGAREFVAGELVECRGGCDRWFFADERMVFAIRLPAQDATDE